MLMSKSAATITQIMQALYNAAPLPDYGVNIQVNLHTADPGADGTATTNAPGYNGYAPASVPRSGSGFTITDNHATNAAEIRFPECTGGSATISHASTSTSSGQIIHSGALPQALTVSSFITPVFAPGALVLTEA
jgi:hypothetical protein